VSVGTVDRIIHNRGQVTPENIEKVQAIINEYGYVKNVMASNLALNKKYRFAVFLPKSDTIEYWKAPLNGIQKAAQELTIMGVALEYYFFDFNEDAFVQAAQQILIADHDGLVLAPIFQEAARSFLEKYQEKNTPIVLIDSNLPGLKNVFYVGQDSHKSGYLAGKLTGYGLQPNAHILILKLKSINENTNRNNVFIQRIQGFRDYFKEKKANHNFTLFETNSIIESKEVVAPSLFEGIDAVYVPNSRVHFVAHFFEQHHITSVKLIGHELLKENIEYLQKEQIDFLIHQKPEEQGYSAIQLLYKKKANQEENKEVIPIPLEIIVKENYY
jgi:LacI family transcriptional regulator